LPVVRLSPFEPVPVGVSMGVGLQLHAMAVEMKNWICGLEKRFQSSLS